MQNKIYNFPKIKRTVFLIIGGIVLFGALVVGIKFYEKYDYCNGTYILLNDRSISHQEYDYFYNQYYYDYLNNFSSIIGYMNVDTTKSLDEQMYDENRTFEQYFTDCALDQIITIYALNDEGEKESFVYDSEEEYYNFIESIKNSLPDNKSVDDYFRKYYGEYAVEANTEKLLKLSFYASKFKKNLLETKGDQKTKEFLDKLKSEYEISFK